MLGSTRYRNCVNRMLDCDPLNTARLSSPCASKTPLARARARGCHQRQQTKHARIFFSGEGSLGRTSSCEERRLLLRRRERPALVTCNQCASRRLPYALGSGKSFELGKLPLQNFNSAFLIAARISPPLTSEGTYAGTHRDTILEGPRVDTSAGACQSGPRLCLQERQYARWAGDGTAQPGGDVRCACDHCRRSTSSC